MISYVIPTYNRSAVIRDVVKQMIQIAQKQSALFEIILIDDGSSDNTEALIKEMVCNKDCSDGGSRIIGIILDGNYGQQNATLAGVRKAQYPVIITLDDDLEYDVNAIPLIVNGLQSGYDVVYVVNKSHATKVHRKWGTILKESVFSLFLGKPPNVQLTSYRGMNRSISEYVARDTTPHVYLSARILQKTKNIGMVETNYHLDQPVQTNYNNKKLVLLLWRIIWNYALFANRSGKNNSIDRQYRIKWQSE